MNFVSIFGSSKSKESDLEYKRAYKIGYELSKKGYVIKCGAYQGVMEACAKGAFDAGGEAIGEALEFFEDKRAENPYLSKKNIHKDIFDRLRGLMSDSKLFVICDGSLGTLNELVLIWTILYIENRQDIRICIVTDRFDTIKSMPIDRELFKYLEFFDSEVSFLESI
jgi:hypothetical protein